MKNNGNHFNTSNPIVKKHLPADTKEYVFFFARRFPTLIPVCYKLATLHNIGSTRQTNAINDPEVDGPQYFSTLDMVRIIFPLRHSRSNFQL